MANLKQLQDLAALYRQLSALATAGVSPADSAGVVAMAQQMTVQMRGPKSTIVRRVLETIRQDVWHGMKLSEAMARWPNIFPAFHLLIVAEGETTGRIDQALNRLAEITERDIAFVQGVRKQPFIPWIFLVIGLPAIFLAAIAHMLNVVPWWAIGLLFLSFSAIRWLGFLVATVHGQSNPGALRTAMKLPMLGKVARQLAIAYFARTMGMLHAAGVPITQTLWYAADASGNAWLADPVKRIIPQIEAGYPLKNALASTGLFPSHILAVLDTAEMTGNLDDQMQRTSKFFEEEAAYQLRMFYMVLRFLLVLIDGIVTVFTAAVVYKAYYSGMINDPFSAHFAF